MSNLHGEIGCTNSGMFYGTIKEDVFGDGSFMPTVGVTQDFTVAGVQHYLHGHGVPYQNVIVKGDK
jgi:hypothetical protein